MSDLHCPACHVELDLAVVFAAEEDHRVLNRLINISIPLGNRVFAYLSLHKPLKQRLTAAKKLKLVSELLPDLERTAISYKGRELAAPLGLWAQAFDALAARRESLDLPLKGHGYLYSVLAGLAEKAEKEAAREEAQTEASRRTAPPASTVIVRGQPMGINQALQVVYAGKDPALAKLDDDARRATPMPPEVRAKLDALKAKTGAKP